MTDMDLVTALRRNMMETKLMSLSLMCLGCGHEHDCGIHGCAILREAADRLVALQADLDRVTAERDAAVADLYKASTHSPCNTGICTHKNCTGNHIPCGFEWRGPQKEG